VGEGRCIFGLTAVGLVGHVCSLHHAP
jgi:hypothetical protein